METRYQVRYIVLAQVLLLLTPYSGIVCFVEGTDGISWYLFSFPTEIQINSSVKRSTDFSLRSREEGGGGKQKERHIFTTHNAISQLLAIGCFAVI